MNEEILAEVKSIMTYDDYKAFFLFSLFRRKSYKPIIILYSIISFLVIITALCQLIFWGFDIISAIMLIIMLFLGALIFYLAVLAPKNYYKTAKSFIETPTIFRFTSEYLEVESKSETASSNSSFKYDVLYKIYEMDEVFYFFISNRQACMIPKNDIPAGTLKQLREIFQFKLGKKYRNYCKK